MPMKVALLQMRSGDDKARNLEQAARLVDEAVAAERPDLVALPEVFPWLGRGAEGRRVAAETLPDGEAYGLLRALARRHGILVHGGSLLERDGERLYNTTVVFDRDGREVARYRKIHLFDVTTPDGTSYRESDSFGRGTEVVTVDLEGWRLGLSICYDMRFPELYQALARKGAEILLVPSNFTLMTGKDHWEPLLRARAIETQCYVLAPAQWGAWAGGTRHAYGHTLAIDPWGHVVARAPDRVGWITARLDRDHLDHVRSLIPVAAHKVL
jgi:deaminated glutathione amidase